MRVYGFKENEKGIMKMENSLKAEQAFVEGYIEVVCLTEEIDLVCNEEGKYNGLKENVAWLDEKGNILDIIFGNCFCCRHNEEGEFTNIQERDIETIETYLKKIIGIVGNTVVLEA